MQINTLSAFQKRLQEGANVALILAEERLCHQSARALLPTCEEVVRLEGEGLSPMRLLNELESQSLFVRRRIVEIETVDKVGKSTETLLVRYCERTSPHLLLILYAHDLPASSPLRRAVDTHGVVFQLLPLRWEAEAVAWVEQCAKERTVTLAPLAALKLVERVGLDRAALQTDLEKLAAFVGWKRPITPQDVEQLCPACRSESFWDLARALLERDGARAMRLLATLLDGQESPFALLAQLRSQFQMALQLCDAGEEGASFPFLQGRRLSEMMARARKAGPVRLKRALIATFEVEHACKSVQVPPQQLLEFLVARVSR